MPPQTRKYYDDWALKVLAILAVLYTLKVAKDVMLPITLAFIFSLLLAPAVARLQRWHLPRSMAAMLILSGAVTLLAAGFYALASPAAEWLSKTPEAVDHLRSHLGSVDTESSNVDAATRGLDSLAEELSAPANPGVERVIITDAGWRDDMWNLATNIGGYGTLSVILLFFLLSSGEELLRRFIDGLPTSRDKNTVKELARQAQQQMSRYLMTITMVNSGVGLVTALALYLLDFPDPALWGALAGILRYIPYLGVSITVMLLTIVSATTYQTMALVVAAPMGYALFTALVGQIVDPFVHGFRFSLNPIIVFLWIFFWGWLWGAAGVLLAVPLLTLFQVLCRHTERLTPLARILGEPNYATRS